MAQRYYRKVQLPAQTTPYDAVAYIIVRHHTAYVRRTVYAPYGTVRSVNGPLVCLFRIWAR